MKLLGFGIMSDELDFLLAVFLVLFVKLYCL